MTLYKVICHPNWNEWECEVEANSVDEAIQIANEEADQNCCFIATKKDVEEIEEG